MISSLEELVEFLKNKKWHISFAESLTGGMCASTLIDVAGSSEVINESFVTYSNESKMKTLNVKKETIDRYSVVSEDVAYEMAVGLNKVTNAEVCLSTTGIAGPTSDGIHKVGEVCFGFYINGNIETREMNFNDIGRNNVRKEACKYLFSELFKLLCRLEHLE